MQRMSKYFGTPKDSTGEPLVWPGTQEGFPFRGSPPQFLTQQEYEEVPLAYNYHAKVFTLPRDLAEFGEVMDKIANGLFMAGKRTDMPLADEKSFLVLLEWCEVFGLPPRPGARPAGG